MLNDNILFSTQKEMVGFLLKLYVFIYWPHWVFLAAEEPL